MVEQKEDSVTIEEFKHANISLILDSYNDIFSSFDARSFAEKSLSVDFLDECKRATRDKDETDFELILSLPKSKRNLSDEFKIKKRLRDHFKHHAKEKSDEIAKIKKQGITWVIIGAVLMFILTSINTYVKNLNFFFNLMLIIIEPASWFSFWEGLGKIFIHSRTEEPEQIFYQKMSNASIIFRGY